MPLLTRALSLGIAVSALLSAPSLCAQTSAADRLQRSTVSTALDTPGLKPWHLKANIQVFDPKGDLVNEGTVEEWWGGPGLRKVVYDTPTIKATYIRNSKDIFVLKGSTLVPSSLALLLQQITHPMPTVGEVQSSLLEFRPQDFGKVPLDCIILAQTPPQSPPLPLGTYPSYCLDRGTDNLRVTYDDQTLLLRDGSGHFQGHDIATQITLKVGAVKRATAQITALGTLANTGGIFDETDDFTSSHQGPIKVSGVVIGGMIRRKVKPIYPEVARLTHRTGVVTLHGIISAEGKVTDLTVVSSPDDSLSEAALTAVRQWTYKPYFMFGEPTPVDTTLTVNFSR